MRRIDVIGIGVGTFVAGGLIYLAFSFAGLDGLSAGSWSQVIFVAGLLGWTATYLARALGKNMPYYQQLEDYEDAVLQKRLEEMSPEEIAQLQAEVEQERLAQENLAENLAQKKAADKKTS